MRLNQKQIKIDHDNLIDINIDDHHPEVKSFKVTINGQAISGRTAWEKRFSLGKANYKSVQAILRGYQTVDIQGHTGVVVMAASVSANSSGYSNKPYGSGYPTCYMGSYSRLHGDSYLTPSLFSANTRLRDVYIDTGNNEVVIEFYNISTYTQTMSCYGLVVVK